MALFKKTPSRKTHEEMRTSGKNSIFFGSIIDDLELDDYLMEQFSVDFGFEIYPPDGPEIDSGAAKPIPELLDGFSTFGNDNWVHRTIEMADKKGIKTSCCAIIFYNLEYDPNLINPKGSGLVQFIGAVDTE